ncbi:MAG: PAS domain S-box protein, partial [Candidatus Thermoplasmatota archaeon]
LTTAQSPKKALELLEKEEFDVVVSDYQMPDMDGLEFLEEVREERESDIPFIIFTGKGREEVAMEALNLGADRYLQKGGDPKTQFGVLADAIKQETSHYKSEKERMQYTRELKFLNDVMINVARMKNVDEICDYIAEKVYSLNQENCVVVALYDRDIEAIRVRSVAGFDEHEQMIEEQFVSGEEKITFDPDMLAEWEEKYRSGNLELMPEGLYSLVKGVMKKEEARKFEELFGVEEVYSAGFSLEEKPYGGITILKSKKGDPRFKSAIETIGSQLSIILRKKQDEKRQRLSDFSLDKASLEIYWITPEGRFIFANETVSERLGYPKEELKDMHVWDVDPNHDKDIREERWEMLKEKGTLNFESEHETKDGEVYPVEITSSHLEFDGKEYEFAFAEDITERKKAEERLKESEERYRTLFNSIRDAILVADTDRNIINCNPAFVDLFGYELEEIEGKKTEYVYHDVEQYEEMAEEIKEHMGEEDFYFTIDYEKKSGEVFPGETKVFYLKDDEGEITGFIGLIRDITERKEAEKEIKHRENLERIITEASTGFVNTEVEEIDETIFQALKKIGEFAGADRSYFFQFYKNLEKMDMTHEWCAEGIEPQQENMQNFSTDNLPWLMKKVKDFENIKVPKVDNLPSEAEEFEEVLQEQNIKSLLVLPLISDNELQGLIGFDWVKKEKRWSEEVVNLLRVAGETIQSALDRKEREKKLRESKQRLDLALKGTKAAIWDWYVQTGETVFDERWAEIVGYELEELEPTSIETWRELAHPEDLERSEKLLEDHFAGETDMYEFEGRMKHKDGHWVSILDRGKVVEWDDEGNPIRMTGTHIDITERKKAEQELKRSKSKYETLFEENPEGVVEVDEDFKIVSVNEQFKDLFDYEEEGIKGENPNDLIVPEDKREEAEELDEKSKEGYFKHETVRLTKDGEEVPVAITGRPIKQDGKTHYLGVYRDISERKEAENQVRKNKEKIERLHEVVSKLENAQSEEEVTQTAVDAAEDVLEFSVCSIDLVDESGKFVVKAASKEVSSEDYMEAFPEKSHLGGKTFLNDESYMVDDLQAYEDAKPVKDEYKSAVSVPITGKGVFQAISNEKGYFNEDDLKMAELLMDHVKEALERVEMEEREEFLHSLLRHDVQNKTQLVKGYLHLLEEDIDLPDEADDYIQKAEKVTKASDEIIEKVRKLNQIKQEDEIGEVEVDSVLDQVLTEHESQLEKEGIDIEVQTSGCKVKGGTLLQEMISNLVENSIKHSGCDTLRIKDECKEDECVLIVEDDGKGIPEDVKEKIFDRGFKEGENAGSGLGMYLVKEIVESYDGSVEVKDSELGGARFDVHLQRIE